VLLIIQKFLEYAEHGKKDKHWYRDCEQTFIKLFGEPELKTVCKLFAATSINTSLKANITLFRRAYFEIKNDLPFSNYLPNIKMQLEKVRAGKPLSGEKINNFAEAMAGNENAVVVDVWILRAYDNDKKYFRHGQGYARSAGATPKQYKIIEAHIKETAVTMDLKQENFAQ